MYQVELRAMLRLGQYQKALDAEKKVFGARPISVFGVAAVFMVNNEQALKDAADLKGVLRVTPGREANTFWATRYDDRVFFIDAQRKVREFPGVDTRVRPNEVDFIGYACAFTTGSVYVTQTQLYWLDEAAGHWVPSYAAKPCGHGGDVLPWNKDTFPLALEYAIKHYPARESGRELVRSEKGPGSWRWWNFVGDIVLVARASDSSASQSGNAYHSSGQVVDVNAEVKRQTGSKQVAAYPPVVLGEDLAIPTDCGLWIMDGKSGTLSQVDLGIKAPAAIVPLNWPVRPGKAYFGLPPQQGGQVLEMDVQTRKVSVTKGYCGVGPDDACMYLQKSCPGPRYQYALEDIYRKAHAATQPSSQP